MRSIAYALPASARLRRAQDLRRLAGMARQHHAEVKFQSLAEEGGRAPLAQGATIRPADARRRGSTAGRSGAPALRCSMCCCSTARPRHRPPGAVLRGDRRQGRGLPPLASPRPLKRLAGARAVALAAPLPRGRRTTARFRLVQETNAYASLPPSQWKGYHGRPRPRRRSPAPGATTLPCPIRSPSAAEELRAQPGAHRSCSRCWRLIPATNSRVLWRASAEPFLGPQT